MRKIETSPAEMMWVIRAIYIWLEHSLSDRTIEISSLNHLNTVRVLSTKIWGSHDVVGCKWLVAAVQEYMECTVHRERSS